MEEFLPGSVRPSSNEDPVAVLNRTALAMLLEQMREQEACQKQEMPMPCDERPLYRNLMGHGFFVVFVIALIGNCLNLFIYNSDQIRFYVAIRMLCTKLLMNTLMMAFLVPQALRVINFWEKGSESERLYWKFWPYQAYCINVFGFCAMWLTVLMTAECYLHVFFPSRSKTVCTKKNLSRGYIIMTAVGMLLALIYPLNRTIYLQKQCSRFVVNIIASESFLMKAFERAHAVANLFLAILIPLALLVFMTASIVWRLRFRSPEIGATMRYGAEKRCVTRITLITTGLQVITEAPSVPVFIFATLFGPDIVTNDDQMCAWQTISHFLGLFNASMSFFVYISFSNRFRESIRSRAQQLLFECFPKLASRPLDSAKTRTYTSFISQTGNERTYSEIRRPNYLGALPPPNSDSLASVNTELQLIVSTHNGSSTTDCAARHLLSQCPTPSSIHDSFL